MCDRLCSNCEYFDCGFYDMHRRCINCKSMFGKPYFEPKKTEAKKFIEKNGEMDIASLYPTEKVLIGDLNSGYRYVYTDSIRKNIMYGMLPNVEKFCKKNNISCTIDYLSRFNLCCYSFKHRSSNKKHTIKIYLDGLRSNQTIIENNIIKNLYAVFNLKEENTMPTTNYNKMYTGRNFWKDIQPSIKDVKFSGPCTIVFWSDGDKTIVRCGEDEQFDKEKGLAMAICKKMLGTNKSKSNFNDIFKKFISHEEENEGDDPEDVSNTVFMSLKEAAEHYGVSKSTMLRKIAKGEITNAVKVDGKWIIPVEED